MTDLLDSDIAFRPAHPPRSGRLALHPPGSTAPAHTLPVADALPALLQVWHEPHRARPSGRFWAAAAVAALRRVADRDLTPRQAGHGSTGHWRTGPLPTTDQQRLATLAAALPDPPPAPLVREFLDAVADTLADDHPHDPAPTTDPPAVHLSLQLAPTGPDLSRTDWRATLHVRHPADPSLTTPAGALWRPGGPPATRTGVLLRLRHATAAFPPLHRLLHQPVPDTLTLTPAEAASLAGDTAAHLTAAGIDVHWPEAVTTGLSTAVEIDLPEPTHPSSTGPLTCHRRLLLDGAPLTTAEAAQVAAAHGPVLRLRDRWVLTHPATRDHAHTPAPPPLPATAALAAALTGTVHTAHGPEPVVDSAPLARLRDQLTGRPTRPAATPAGLAGTLRDYQLHGLRWLAHLTTLGLGACLADDMGLGKTVTLIALHLHRNTDPATTGPTLVICPASLLGTWEQEITRFAPCVPVRRYHGPGRHLTGTTGFVLTTYATLRSDTDQLAGHPWTLVVADEAQHAKNPRSTTARALRRLPATARVALTGTPVENHLTDLWAILDWTTPGLLDTLPTFRARYATPVETGTDPQAAARLAALTGPFLLRRRKTDPEVAPELPARTETDTPAALTPEQAELYTHTVQARLERIRDRTGTARRGLVLRMLTQLKQICNHPAHYHHEPDPVLAGRSGKLDTLDELVDTALAGGGTVLVFTQYVTMARLLDRHLSDRGHTSALLHGGTPLRRRETLVARFQQGEVPVLVLSLKAAGTGLTLTRADHVIHYDRWWNPAVEQQATDRAHRIGQTRPVQVHRLVTEGTVEQRIAALLHTKRALADAVLTAGDTALTELTDRQLADLVTLRSHR